MIGRFDGGRISSDGGGLLLREVDHRIGLPDRLAGWQQQAKDQFSGGGGASTSRIPLDCKGPTTPLRSICSIMRAARL